MLQTISSFHILIIASFAEMYQKDTLTGGHVIMLGPGNTEAVRNIDFLYQT
jgi:hypothetical protein